MSSEMRQAAELLLQFSDLFYVEHLCFWLAIHHARSCPVALFDLHGVFFDLGALDLNLNEAFFDEINQRFMADKEKWAQVQDVTSAGYAKYQGMLMELICFAEGLRGFRQLINMMAGKCLEPLKRRNSSAYAEAYSYF